MTDEMKLTHTIALLGGDLRQLAAADALRAAGYRVTLSGFDAEAGTENLPLAEALAEAEVLLLPLPTIRHDRINLPFSDERLTVSALLTWLTANRPPHLTQVFGGVIPAALTEGLRALGLRVTDLCSDTWCNRNKTALHQDVIYMSGMKGGVDWKTIFINTGDTGVRCS